MKKIRKFTSRQIIEKLTKTLADWSLAENFVPNYQYNKV